MATAMLGRAAGAVVLLMQRWFVGVLSEKSKRAV
jgi:hypothetical protein